MKKFTLIALALAMTLGASAQRKTWDFTKGFSAATIAGLTEDAASSSATWVNTSTDKASSFESKARAKTGPLTYTVAGVTTVIPETEGLTFNGKSKQHLNIVSEVDGMGYVWLNGKKAEDQLVIPKVPAGQTVTIVYNSHKNTEARGFKSITKNFADAAGKTTWTTTTLDTAVVVNNNTDTTDYVIQATNGFHIYSIVIGEGDAPAVEENKKVAFIYSPADGYDVESDFAHVFLPSNYDYTDLSASDATVTLDSLQKYDAVIIGNNVATDATLVQTLKSAIAYEPIVNLNSKLYSAWGLGSEVAATSGSFTITKPNSKFAKNWDGFDAESPTYEILTDGNNLNTVSLGEYFAADDTLATVGEAVAIHQHNPLRNSYIFLPLTADLTVANGDNLPLLLGAALKTVVDTKTNVTQAIKPTIKETYADKLTYVSLSAQKNATIYYTLDGSDPTTASAVYSDTLAISDANVTVKAIATLDGYLASDVASKTITVKTQAKAPVITAAPETGKTVVTIATDETGVSVYYNFTGSSVQSESQAYTAPIELTENATVTAFAVGGNFVQSENATEKVEIAGQTEETKRAALVSHYDTKSWYDGSKALYPFSWGKNASSIYETEAAAVPTRAATLKAYEEKVVDGLDWKIISRGQVVTLENTTFTANVNGTGQYCPATALDALPIETSNDQGTVEVTSCATTFGAVASGEPSSAAVQSTKVFQGPFNVVTYCANGNGSGNPKIAVQISTDGENFTTLGDTITLTQGQRLLKRSVVSYDGTEKVYVRVAHAGGAVKAMLADVYVLGTKTNPDAIETGIEGTVVDGDLKGGTVAAIYSVTGEQLGSLQRGVNIVKYTDGTVRKVLVK